MHSIIWTLLFTATAAYRIMEFSQNKCSHREFRAHHLAEANSCAKLEPRVSSSILVKVDNIHDGEYQLKVYDSKDCTGDVVGSISNLNGCMDLFAGDHVGRSVMLTPIEKKPADPAAFTRAFNTGRNYNMHLDKTGHVLDVPISYGVFRMIRPSPTDDGTYLDEEIADFLPKPLKHVLALDVARAVPDEGRDIDELQQAVDAEYHRQDEEKWHEAFLSQAQYVSNKVYAAAAGWGERVLGVE